MFIFRVTGGAARADALVDAVRVFTHATSLGGVESTLERRTRYASERAVVPEDLLRVSVGIEPVEDLWADLEQALAASDRSTRLRPSNAPDADEFAPAGIGVGVRALRTGTDSKAVTSQDAVVRGHPAPEAWQERDCAWMKTSAPLLVVWPRHPRHS